jgi:hypothetical protein
MSGELPPLMEEEEEPSFEEKVEVVSFTLERFPPIPSIYDCRQLKLTKVHKKLGMGRGGGGYSFLKQPKKTHSPTCQLPTCLQSIFHLLGERIIH